MEQCRICNENTATIAGCCDLCLEKAILAWIALRGEVDPNGTRTPAEVEWECEVLADTSATLTCDDDTAISV